MHCLAISAAASVQFRYTVLLAPLVPDGCYVVEQPVVEPSLEAIPGYDEEAWIQYTGGLGEHTGEESLAEYLLRSRSVEQEVLDILDDLSSR